MTLISIFIQDKKRNITIENNIPLAYIPYLKVSKHIPFVDKKTQKMIEKLLPSLNENAIGLKIEVENNKTYVKIEAIYADIH